MDIYSELSSYKRYYENIERIYQKYLVRNNLFLFQQDGVSFATMCHDMKGFARAMARDMMSCNYRLAPATTRSISIKGKQRQLYAFRPTDLIVHSVVSCILNDKLESRYTDSLYSYRKGYSWWGAISKFAAYIREHCKHVKNRNSRGLFVLRRDVARYSDTIPLEKNAPLWNIVRNILNIENTNNSHQEWCWDIVQQIIRPDIISVEGNLYTNISGVPTGSPISTSIFNLYLHIMDQQLDNVPGAFYARYSDDILFAHPNHEVVKDAEKTINDMLGSKGLKANEGKNGNIYFNGAGKSCSQCCTYKGMSSIEFLGCQVSFDGTVSLKKKKINRLLRDIRQRVMRTKSLLADKSENETGRVICAAVNQSLEPLSPMCQKDAWLLRRVITNRSQLKDIDYKIALIIASKISGINGVKAFRKIAYRTIREEWGLVSLLYQRNRRTTNRSSDK